VQTFLKENAEKIKEIAGDNAAVTAAVSALTDLDPSSVISGFMENVEATATEAKDAAVEKAADTKDAIEQAANEQIEAGKAALKEKAEETKAAAKEKANEAVDNAAKDIKKGLGI
jgi:poly-gamma-glutamate capsule biosynthesis protein CapA/YwtB (metallophosphatase superfamily)